MMMLSKRLQKKLAKKAQRKELKCAHQAKLHEIMLYYAKQIRTQLQVTTSAVPNNALYSNLTRMSEIELFSNIDRSDLETSVLFDCGGPGNSWTNNDVNNNDTEEEAGEKDNHTCSPQSRCCRIIDRFVHRPHPYNRKYACQELNLIYQLYRLARHDHDDNDNHYKDNNSNSYYCCDAIIDIGGGNANLSCLISLILNVPVICVDFDVRHESLMAEKRMPPQQTINNNTAKGSNVGVTRVECMIQDYTLPSTYKHVLVLGKHCCGTGTDAGIEFVKTYSSQIRGVVFATCCCCKIAHGFGVRSIENVRTKQDSNNSNETCDINNDDDEDYDEDDDNNNNNNNAHENKEEEEDGVQVEAATRAHCHAEEEILSNIQFFDSLYFSSTTTTTTTTTTMDCSVTTTSMTATTVSVAHDNEGLLLPQEHDDDDDHDDDNNVINNSNSNCSTTAKYNLDNYTGLSGASAKRLANAANNDGNKLKNESEIELYRRVLPEIARATSWRNQLHNVQDRKYKYDALSCFCELIEQAEYFESWIQGFRRRRLEQLFGWVDEVLYCSDDVQHSQQNRCLVSGRRRQQLRQNVVHVTDGSNISDDIAGGAGMMTSTETTTTATTSEHGAFFNLLEERFVQLKEILPIDLRPYGVVSRKYEYYPVA